MRPALLRKRAMFPSKPVAVRATKITNAPASSGSTRTDFSFVGSLFRKTAATISIDKHSNAITHPPRDARNRPPHQRRAGRERVEAAERQHPSGDDRR